MADFGTFIFSVVDHWFELLSGCALMVLIALFEKYVLKRELSVRLYTVILACLVFWACFLAWKEQNKMNDALRTTNHEQNSEIVKLRGEVTMSMAKVFEAYKQRDEIALDKAALEVTNGMLKQDKQNLLAQLRDANQATPDIDITQIRLRADNVLVFFWKNSGYARATVHSAESFIFLNGKFHDRQQLIKSSMLASMNQSKTFEAKIPQNLYQDLQTGNVTMSVALEMKYAGRDLKKEAICFEAQFDKTSNSFITIASAPTECRKSLKMHS